MKKILYVILLAAMILVYAFWVNDDLSDCIIRFHVIANSDTKEDQELKLKVRDAVLSEVRELSGSSLSKEESARILSENSIRIKNAAEKTIRECGYSYKADVEYGKFAFPEKKYGNIRLPSGKYDAFRIKIGEAEGHNWWCVMFPPLCLSEGGTMDSASLEYLKENLPESEYEMITDDDLPVIIRFRIVDAAMKLINKTSG